MSALMYLRKSVLVGITLASVFVQNGCLFGLFGGECAADDTYGPDKKQPPSKQANGAVFTLGTEAWRCDGSKITKCADGNEKDGGKCSGETLSKNPKDAAATPAAAPAADAAATASPAAAPAADAAATPAAAPAPAAAAIELSVKHESKKHKSHKSHKSHKHASPVHYAQKPVHVHAKKVDSEGEETSARSEELQSEGSAASSAVEKSAEHVHKTAKSEEEAAGSFAELHHEALADHEALKRHAQHDRKALHAESLMEHEAEHEEEHEHEQLNEEEEGDAAPSGKRMMRRNQQALQ